MTGPLHTRPVLVGYDGSDAARAAILFAAGEALERGRPLHIVHVLEPVPNHPTTPDLGPDGHPRVLNEAVGIARSVLSPERIGAEIVLGVPADVLLNMSLGADLLAVGRGQAGVLGVLLGSVAMACVTHAHCPVAVVAGTAPAGPQDGGAVLVGVDGADGSEQALALAFGEAERRGATLVALHAWHLPYQGAAGFSPVVFDMHALEEAETWVLRAALAPFQEKFPAVAVTERVVAGGAAHALIEASQDARLLVVGSRGRGPVRGTLLGSVGQSAVRHARCPVVVARVTEG